MYSYGDLEYLRKRTILGPIALYKLSKIKSECENATKLVNSAEHGKFGVDYSNADDLEFDLRFMQWKEEVMSLWVKYGGGLNLDDFASMMIHQNQKKDKEVVYARKLK